jgi:hypothetical protein
MSKLIASFASTALVALLSCGWLMFGCQANTVPVPSGKVTPIAPAGMSAAKPTPGPSDDAGTDDVSEDGADDDDEAESGGDSCESDCEARECGSDGCGGSCGRCGRGRVCNVRRGLCQDPPACEDADAGTSGDCAECGNGVIDRGEACDGEADCNPDCTMMTPLPTPEPDPEPAPGPGAATPSLERCMGFLGTDASDACKECVCGECAELAVSCYDSGDPSFDAACGGLAECGNRNGCYDFSCYCGTSALCLAANGPCRVETERAAGSIDVTAVLNCYDTRGCASNRARTLGECLVRNCDSVCGP